MYCQKNVEGEKGAYPLLLSTSSIARRTCVGPGEAKTLPHTAASIIINLLMSDVLMELWDYLLTCHRLG